MPKLNTTTSGIITATLTADSTATLELQQNGVAIRTLGESQLVPATVQSTATGATAYDFTGIPSWAKRVTVLCSGISKSGTANFLFQLGDSGGVETTGYTGGTFAASSGAIIYAAPTNGFQTLGDAAGVVLMYGSIVFTNITDNTWVASGLLFGNSFNVQIAGEKSLSATLDRIRITTTNGTDTFDAGTVNIMWE